MESIIIKAHKTHTIAPHGCYRTSNGWVYNVEEIKSYEIWLSSPIRFGREVDTVIGYLSKHYHSSNIIKDYDDGSRDDSIYNSELTSAICALFNFALSDNRYDFREWKPYEDKDCHFQLVKSYDSQNKGYTFDIIPRQREKEDIIGHVRSYSPYETIADLKDGIARLHNTEIKIPLQWISYLISHAEEDLSPFLQEYNIEIDHLKIPICNDDGVLFSSIQNHQCDSIAYFKKWSGFMSYSTALQLKDVPTIEFFQRFGAKKPYSRHNRDGVWGYDPDDGGYSGYSESELDEMYQDAMGGDPANEWNID